MSIPGITDEEIPTAYLANSNSNSSHKRKNDCRFITILHDMGENTIL
jgi:hypothetical protein